MSVGAAPNTIGGVTSASVCTNCGGSSGYHSPPGNKPAPGQRMGTDGTTIPITDVPGGSTGPGTTNNIYTAHAQAYNGSSAQLGGATVICANPCSDGRCCNTHC